MKISQHNTLEVAHDNQKRYDTFAFRGGDHCKGSLRDSALKVKERQGWFTFKAISQRLVLDY